VDQKAAAKAKDPSLTDDALDRMVKQAIVTRVLHPSYVLHFDEPEIGTCSVGDVLKDPERFEGKTLADPARRRGLRHMQGHRGAVARWLGVIHSFAHGETTYSLRHDYASILAAMEREPKQADKVLVRLARFADLDYSDRARLVTRAHELSGVGKRAINADLKAALAEQSEYDDVTDKATPTKGPVLSNAIDLLRTHPAWRGLLSYDEFSAMIMLARPVPGAEFRGGVFPRKLREDPDLIDATVWLQKDGQIPIDDRTTMKALKNVAMDASYHPVRQYLNGLTWDGVPRLDTWLIDHCGAEDTALNRAIGSRWKIAAVARIMEPGCLVKTVIVLEGPQDFGKSSLLRTIAVCPEWFVDDLGDLTNKDSLLKTLGKWIIEFAEFDSLRKAEASKVKAFLSTPSDNFRLPYGMWSEPHPRHWVGAATINPGADGYLMDETGNVRFWTVECAVGWSKDRRVDLTKLAEVRDQLWAEAVHRYAKDEPYWLDTNELREAQDQEADTRMRGDAREEYVGRIVDNWPRPFLTMADLLACFEIKPDNPNHKAFEIAYGTILKRLGWLRWRRYKHGNYYFPPEAGTDGKGWWHKVREGGDLGRWVSQDLGGELVWSLKDHKKMQALAQGNMLDDRAGQTSAGMADGDMPF
jgi:hypothetical protein